VSSNKLSADLGFNNFYAQFPCNLIGNYTRIFYSAEEGEIPLVQYKMSLKVPLSMRCADDLSIIFNDFYVLSFTACLNITHRFRILEK
jgi:hypothetical protein